MVPRDDRTPPATAAAGDADPSTGPAAGGGPWDRLPDTVRTRLAEIAATAVGALPTAEVPPALRRLARFTPAKRARLGATALLAELRGSVVFRLAVAAWWHEHRPGELDVNADDAATAAAAALLAGDETAADEAMRVSARREESAGLRAERDAALARVEKLTAELERLRGELGDARARLRTVHEQRDAEYQQLRRRIGEQGARLRAALDGRAAAEEAAERARLDAADELAAARAERDRERDRADAERGRADRAAAEVAAARQAAREARQADEVRLGLLLDTAAGALAGLRRELALGGGGPRPADLVGGAQVRPGGGGAGRLAALEALLGLPALHLIVDGYNITKTGYPDLPLADQRERLVGQLAALAARTGVEVTVVFDGAGVVAAPMRGSRGVRVLFSDAGVLADDVIRALVAAEPQGRPVAVATSDRAVAGSVRRAGGHTVPATVLVARLARA